MKLGAYFNQLAQEHKANKLFYKKVDVLADAIRKGNNGVVTSLLDDVKTAPQYNGVQGHLLATAINKDNAPAFNLVLATLADPNYEFVTNSNPGAGQRYAAAYLTQREHVLHAAINAGAEKVALSLANNPAVNVNAESSSTTMIYWSSTKALYGSALALAEQKGMKSVADALKQRGAVKTAPQNKPPQPLI